MRCTVSLFGGYHVAVYGGGVSVAVTSPCGASFHVQGDDAAVLVADYESAVADIAAGGHATRRARIGERAAAQELFGDYFPN